MGIISLLFIFLFTFGCSEQQIEEFAFRKTLEHDLIKLCGDNNKTCITTVKTQIKGCMESSNWRQYLNDQDNEAELNRFSLEFYSCIVDSEGTPLFETKSNNLETYNE